MLFWILKDHSVTGRHFREKKSPNGRAVMFNDKYYLASETKHGKEGT